MTVKRGPISKQEFCILVQNMYAGFGWDPNRILWNAADYQKIIDYVRELVSRLNEYEAAKAELELEAEADARVQAQEARHDEALSNARDEAWQDYANQVTAEHEDKMQLDEVGHLRRKALNVEKVENMSQTFEPGP